MSKVEPNTIAAAILTASLLLVACNNQGSGSSPGPGAGGADPANDLQAMSDFGRITLDWSADGSATVLYSSDPDCDWDNYSICEDSGILLDQASGVTLGVHDGLRLNRNYAFVAEVGNDRSEHRLAAAWAPSIDTGAEVTLVHDSTWYVGGRFDRVAPATGNGALFSLDTGALEGGLQQVQGLVTAVVPDGEGGWFIGGSFSSVAGKNQETLAHIRPDGSLNRDWRPEQGRRSEDVNALLIDQGVLYVGGRFSQFDGEQRSLLAAFDLSSGELTDWAPEVDGSAFNSEVTSLAVVGDQVVFAGNFETVDGEPRTNLAAVSRTGDLKSFAPDLQINASPGSINALAAFEHQLIVAGRFDAAEGEPVGHLAVYDMNTGDLQDRVPEMSSQVRDISVSEDRLHLVGYFASLTHEGETVNRSGVAAFNLSTHEVSSWAPQLGSANSLETVQLHEGNAYIGGSLALEVDGKVHNNLVAVDGTAGDVLPWSVSAGGRVHDLAVSHGRLYAGGRFDTAGGEVRDNLAAFDAGTGELLDWSPRFTARADATVGALEADAERLYVGGVFNTVNDETRRSLAAFALSSGALEDWQPDVRERASTADGRVNAMLLQQGTLYLGGQFHQVDGEDRRSIAAVTTADSGGNWVTGWAPDLDADHYPGVYSLADVDGDIVVGGSFATVNSIPQRNLARLDSSAGAPVGNWNPEPQTRINKVHAAAEYLFIVPEGVSGYASEPALDDTALAAFSVPSLALEADWSPITEDTSSVDALETANGRLIAGGDFTTTTHRHYLAAFRLNDLEPEDWGPSVNGRVLDLHHDDQGRLYGVGRFNRVDGQPRFGMVVLDAQTGEVID